MTDTNRTNFEYPDPDLDAMGDNVFARIAAMRQAADEYSLALECGHIRPDSRNKAALWARLGDRAASNAKIDLHDPEVVARVEYEQALLRYRN